MRLREEAQLQRFDAQLQRALEINDDEADVHGIVSRALTTVLPGVGTEMLLADSSDCHLRRVAHNPEMPAPQCPVEGPAQCASIRRGQTLSFESSEHLDACPRLRLRESACSAVCTPVSVMGRSIGVLHAAGEVGQPLSRDQVQALRLIATHTGTRIGVLRTLSTTRLQAQRDALTGLLNRRSFRDAVGRQLANLDRGAVVMVDLDHFKKLNDTAGHEMGDRALQLFARVTKATLRPGDVIGRWGGEEFTLLLPGCGGTQATAVLERMRSKLQATLDGSQIPNFTISAGVASYPDHGQTLDDLVREADRALYDAKQSGRDRVVLAGGVVTSDPPVRLLTAKVDQAPAT